MIEAVICLTCTLGLGVLVWPTIEEAFTEFYHYLKGERCHSQDKMKKFEQIKTCCAGGLLGFAFLYVSFWVIGKECEKQ